MRIHRDVRRRDKLYVCLSVWVRNVRRCIFLLQESDWYYILWRFLRKWPVIPPHNSDKPFCANTPGTHEGFREPNFQVLSIKVWPSWSTRNQCFQVLPVRLKIGAIQIPLRVIYIYRQRHHFCEQCIWSFNAMCKQRNRNILNPFLNSTKNGDIDGTCQRTFSPNVVFIFIFLSCFIVQLNG